MSNVPPRRQSNEWPTPIDAEIVEQPHRDSSQGSRPPRRKRSWLLSLLGWGTAIFFLCLFVGGMIVMAVIRAVPDVAALQESSAPPVAWQPVEHREEIADTLDGTWQVAADDPKYFPIRKLLAKLERTAASDSPEDLQELIDWPAHMPRVYAAYRFQPIDALDRIHLRQMAREDADMPDEARDFKIASVNEVSPDDWLVYTYAHAGELIDTPYLFQFRRTENQWKLVDWCEILELRWQSESNAMGAGPVFSDHEGEEQRRFIDDLIASDELRDQGDHAEAQALLRQAETRQAITRLHDSNLHLMGVRWQMLGEYEEALRLYELAHDPDRLPWLHYLAANCHYRLNNYEVAIAKCQQYEQVAGFHFDVALVKAYSLELNDHLKEAAQVALALLRHRPDNPTALSEALDTVPAERFEEIFELVGSSEETLESLVSNASNLLYNDNEAGYRALREFIASHSTDQGDLLLLDGQLLHYQGELDPALAKFRELIDYRKQQDGDDSWQAFQSYFEVAMKLYAAEEVYRQAPAPRETMELLTEDIDYDEAWINIEQLAKIIPLHEQAEPQDPRNAYYAALVAMHQHEYEAAVQQLEQALAEETSTGPVGDEYLVATLHEQLQQARYYQGNLEQAYSQAESQSEAYSTLAALTEADTDWSALRKLNQLHRPGPDTAMLSRYYQLRLQEQQLKANHDEALRQQILKSYKQLQSDDQQGQVYAYWINSRLEALGTQSQDWRSYVEQLEDPEGVLERLLARFQREQNQAELSNLLSLMRSDYSESNALFNYELEQLWEQADYAGYIAKIGDWPSQRVTDQYYAGWEKRERLVICHLIQGDLEAATHVAHTPNPDKDLLLYVKIASGELASVRELLTDEEVYFSLPPDQKWLKVPAVNKFFQSEEFHQLRREIPLTLLGENVGTRAVLFYRKVHQWNVSTLEDLLAESGIETVKVENWSADSLVSHTFRLTTPAGVCLLTVGSKPFLPANELADHVSANRNDFIKAAESYQSWLALELSGSASAEMESTWQRLLSAIVCDATVVWGNRSGSYRSTTLIDPQQIAQLAEGTHLTKLSDETGSAWLPFADVSYDDYGNHRGRKWYSRLRAKEASTPTGRVRIQLRQGSVREQIWLDVQSVKHENWGNYEVIAVVNEPSLLNAYLQSGDLVTIRADEILQWDNESNSGTQ